LGRKTLGFAGLLLAFGALVRPGPSVNNQENALVATHGGSIVPTATLACGADDDGPWKGIEGLFGVKSQDKPYPWSEVPAGSEFLIASVPDPATTHLALDFDRAVESIILAAGDSGFSFQRHWTPWRSTPEKELSLLADRKCQQQESELRNKQPGLLVFQNRNGRPLLIFLVGESPTSGVNADQLANSVRYIHTMTPYVGDRTIRVIGPSFSGSLPSLPFQLAAFPGVKFHLTSGMVTAEKEIDRFEGQIAASGGKFESTVESDQRATKLFFEYAKSHWHSHSRTALLAEADTPYARDVALPRDVDGLTIRYPREISRLRNAYQEESAMAQKSGEPVAAAPALPFTLKDTDADSSGNSEKDSMPAFSRLQSPASQQTVMAGIVSAIRRERTDFVGIVATDVLDALFLSRYLRASCPDTRLFVPDADLLFSTQSNGGSFEGLLSITTYPLFSRNQGWTGDPGKRTQFASRYAEGVYNASRHLLDPAAILTEYTRPGERTTRPPLWLTVMGRDGYWPLALPR
jgi:hypothetical protein